MTIISRLLENEPIQSIALSDETRFIQRQRYCYESTIIGHLARYALNKPKNVLKDRFESLPIPVVIKLLEGELEELRQELETEGQAERILDELADCAGMLVAVLVSTLVKLK